MRSWRMKARRAHRDVAAAAAATFTIGIAAAAARLRLAMVVLLRRRRGRGPRGGAPLRTRRMAATAVQAEERPRSVTQESGRRPTSSASRP